MNCVWCDEAILLELNWRSFFKIERQSDLCANCRSQLELIKGNKCRQCSKSTNRTICQDCQAWSQVNWQQLAGLTKDPLDLNVSVFVYNEFMKELITKWKYRGDYELVKAFKHEFTTMFMRHFKESMPEAVLVPIPLSEERERERGFNQSLSLAKLLSRPIKEVLTRRHGEKQAKKSRDERINTENPFILQEKFNKNVILVDDIYTTGATLRHAASLLKQNGCPNVFAFTLIRG